MPKPKTTKKTAKSQMTLAPKTASTRSVVMVVPQSKPARQNFAAERKLQKELLEKERALAKERAKLREERTKAGAQIREERAKAKFMKGMAERQLLKPEGLRVGDSQSLKFYKTGKTGTQNVVYTTKTKRRYKTKEQAEKHANSLGFVTVASGATAIAVYSGLDRMGIETAIPTQEYTGISLAGWLGVGAIILARFVFSDSLVKDGAYAIGLSLVAYEINRQVQTNFEDFSNLFNELELEVQGYAATMGGGAAAPQLSGNANQAVEQAAAAAGMQPNQ